MHAPARPPGFRRVIVGVQVALLLALAAPAPGLAAPTVGGLTDKDFRVGTVQPTSAQISRVTQLGASVRWNNWGTPQSLIKHSGWLASGLSGAPETAARNWVRTNRTLFRLTDADVTNLELVSSNPIGQGRAVLFRQRFGNLKSAQDGLIIVAITGGKVAYVSSSATGTKSAPQSAILSAQQAWLRAAAHVGKPINGAALGATRTVGDWTVFSATGLKTPTFQEKSAGSVDQRARLVAVPTYNSARAVVAYETIVLDTSGAEPVAYTVFVDARDGSILMRYSRIDHLDRQEEFEVASRINNEPTFGQFSGTTNANGQCGPDHAIVAPAGTTSITVVASAVIPANDIVLDLYNSALVQVAHMDSGTSPEAIHYEIAPPLAAPATYYARVCQFAADDPLEPFSYEGAFATNDADTSAAQFNYPPKWKYFQAHPSLANDPSPEDYDFANTDTRVVGYWVLVHNGGNVPGCSTSVGKLQNLASRVPWDHIVQTNAPSFTTIGNNAVTGEAWTTPLTPGPLQQRPVSLEREYVYPFTNAWNQSRCATTNLVPGGNDIDAAVTNLFAAHNRMHDWSYFLGFTEDAYNLQTNNFGNNPGVLAENDPEFGQVQSGALLPVEAGVSRDNANQITLNDGVPGITNMYLWQPIAGIFYAPCVDGDYDMAVIGHEYGHAISNRMAGGPDASLSGTQARAMGESWSDLMAMEYLNEFGLVPTNGESRYVVGAYATGNNQRGIRNFNMSTSPLNYSDVGYDFVCNQTILGPDIEGLCPDKRTQVHADGEIWSATNFELRQAFIAKYNSSFPASNDSRQRACAQGTYPASSCPGNRRWAQIMFDAWLLMPAAVSMLDARDAYLGADMMRFNGVNQKLMWKVFAHRGFGVGASSSPSDIDPKPSFQSPLEQFKNVTFKVVAADEGNALIANAKIYVGQFEAAVTPIADTVAGGTITDTARFVNGDYEFIVAAPGYGHVRFPRTFVGTGNVTVEVRMSTNRASLAKGAVATGTGTNFNNLFDDTELTNWTGPSPVVAGAAFATVDLQGGVQNVKRINVSALLNPENGGRFRALRQFEIWTCNGSAATCAVNSNFTKIYTSPANAFPGVRPRPVAPDLNLRAFDVPDTNATHVQLRVVSNQCTATGTGFRGDQDADPLNDSDCVSGSDADLDVKAAELQVFSSTPNLPARDPAVAVTLTAPTTATSGSQITYTAKYTNAGPNESSSAVLTDVLPAGLTFVSASNGATYNATTRTVRWNLGTVNVGYTGTRSLTVTLNGAAGNTILNEVTYTAPETVAVSIPAATVIE